MTDTCDRFRSRLASDRDRALADQEASIHLDLCDSCRDLLELVDRLPEEMGHPPPPSSALMDRLSAIPLTATFPRASAPLPGKLIDDPRTTPLLAVLATAAMILLSVGAGSWPDRSPWFQSLERGIDNAEQALNSRRLQALAELRDTGERWMEQGRELAGSSFHQVSHTLSHYKTSLLREETEA